MSQLASCPVCGDIHNEDHIIMHLSLQAAKSAEERIRLANETGSIKFSSGRMMEPDCGVIGLSPNLDVFSGYNRSEHYRNPDEPSDDQMPSEDLTELADIMIDRWQRFKDSL